MFPQIGKAKDKKYYRCFFVGYQFYSLQVSLIQWTAIFSIAKILF